MGQYEYNDEVKQATTFTAQANKKFAEDLGLDTEHCTNEECDVAAQHCIYPTPHIQIPGRADKPVWNLDSFSFFEQESVPDTVNPSLWTNGKSNYCSGVFEVVKNAIYQVRGIDCVNLTIIRSKTGWIVQDVLNSMHQAKAALELLEKALGEEVKSKVRAVIISHTHPDHFGGITAVVSPEQVGSPQEGKIPIYAPTGFKIGCVKEHAYSGPAMNRRINYQFASEVPAGPQGLISTGLGLEILADARQGASSFIMPTNYIEKDGVVNIDGIDVEFMLTPGTEAPAEMNDYFPAYRALCMAENCNGTMHNLYTLRGVHIRDASVWVDYLLKAMVKFADRSDVVFVGHNWPHFNTKENPHAVRDYIFNTAAMYKHIHDQTLFYANQGYTEKEIARMVKIPEGLKHNWYTRPYYGAVPMNSRAVYVNNLGFYNGNPNNIDPLTEVEEAKEFVKYAGSAENIIEKAEEEFLQGQYREAANAAGKVVLADPANKKARQLCADAFEQLGYAAENGIWRNAYLQGAYELRHGIKKEASAQLSVYSAQSKNGPSMQQACMDADLILKYLAVMFDNDSAANEEFAMNFRVSENPGDAPLNYVVAVHSGVMLTYVDENSQLKDYVELTKDQLYMLAVRNLDVVKDEIKTNNFDLLKKIEGYLLDLSKHAKFPMIEPVNPQ